MDEFKKKLKKIALDLEELNSEITEKLGKKRFPLRDFQLIDEASDLLMEYSVSVEKEA